MVYLYFYLLFYWQQKLAENFPSLCFFRLTGVSRKLYQYAEEKSIKTVLIGSLGNRSNGPIAIVSLIQIALLQRGLLRAKRVIIIPCYLVFLAYRPAKREIIV